MSEKFQGCTPVSRSDLENVNTSCELEGDSADNSFAKKEELQQMTPKQLSSIFSSLSVAPDQQYQAMQPVNANHHANTSNIYIIGAGSQIFQVVICIEKCQQLVSVSSNKSGSRNVWLSYRFCGAVVQSEIFSISGNQGAIGFTPTMSSFRLRSSLPELGSYFNDKKNATLRVHLCTEGEVLGTFFVDLRQLADANNQEEYNYTSFHGRVVHNDYIVKAKKGSNELSSTRISVRLCIDRERPSPAHDTVPKQLVPACNPWQSSGTAAISLSTSCQTVHTLCADKASSPIQNEVNLANKSLESCLLEKERHLNTREAQLSKKETEIFQAVATLEKKRCEFEQWRHRQELEWHAKLRDKEAAMMRQAEDRCTEKLGSMENSKNEYERLEARLRKAIIEVERKERQLKDIEQSHQNERARKMAELESKEKLLKHELNSTVEIERAKVNAAVEQAVVANKKASQIEAEMKELREQHKAKPEVTLMHEIAQLKGQLAESERRIEALKSEKNLVTSEKEQFRKNVHKLAKALRKEREKLKSTKQESNNQQVRLSYDANAQSFVLGGGSGDEIKKILSDLSKISQIKGPGDTNNSPHMPIPSPQPSHPMTSMNNACSPYVDGMMATPGGYQHGYGTLPASIFPKPINLSPGLG